MAKTQNYNIFCYYPHSRNKIQNKMSKSLFHPITETKYTNVQSKVCFYPIVKTQSIKGFLFLPNGRKQKLQNKVCFNSKLKQSFQINRT